MLTALHLQPFAHFDLQQCHQLIQSTLGLMSHTYFAVSIAQFLATVLVSIFKPRHQSGGTLSKAAICLSAIRLCVPCRSLKKQYFRVLVTTEHY